MSETKSKDPNKRLGEAYARVSGMTMPGARFIKEFNPATFDLTPHLDRLAGQVIGPQGETSNRPQMVVMGVRCADGWRCVYYESPFGELSRREFNLDATDVLSLFSRYDSTFFYASRAEFTDKGLASLIAHLESRPFMTAVVRNLFSFFSSGLFVLAANYDRGVDAHDTVILNALVTQSFLFKQIADQARRAEEDVEHTIRTLVRVAALPDHDEGRHAMRVGEYSALLALRLGLGENFSRTIRLQAQLHDLGNIFVPVGILKKEGVPDFQEWDIIRSHTRWGAQIIGAHPRLAMAAAIALSHHENWDGTGYPNWLKGEQIPLAGRIVALADRYDALRVIRPYKPAMEHDAVCELILGGNERSRPEHFDPTVLAAFRELAPRFAEIYTERQGIVDEWRNG